MLIAKVIKKIVSTIKNEAFTGRPLLMVQPMSADLRNQGDEVLCIDFLGADIGELVLIMKEGGSVNDLMNTKKSPADAAIIGIIDKIDLNNRCTFDKNNLSNRENTGVTR